MGAPREHGGQSFVFGRKWLLTSWSLCAWDPGRLALCSQSVPRGAGHQGALAGPAVGVVWCDRSHGHTLACCVCGAVSEDASTTCRRS